MSGREGHAPSQRQLRVGEEIRHSLATVLERGELRDPGLQGTPLTVTEVRATPDLRHATVYVVPLGGGDCAEALKALNRARPYLRRQIARAVHLKYAPDLHFRADETFDEASHINTLMHNPHVSQDIGKVDDLVSGPDGEDD